MELLRRSIFQSFFYEVQKWIMIDIVVTEIVKLVRQTVRYHKVVVALGNRQTIIVAMMMIEKE